MAIEITVGLPIYRAQNIAWLALESLCRQKMINFDWELLIAEEESDPESEHFAVGFAGIKKFIPSLKKNGCKRIEYYNLEKWEPLSLKWYRLIKESSSTKAFLLQAADCYAQPFRLRETLDLFLENENLDWLQSKEGFFYDILTEKLVLYDHDKRPKNRKNLIHPCALNMAIKTDLFKRLSPFSKKRSVDGALFEALSKIKKKPLCVGWNNSPNWKNGLDTSGLNNLSVGRVDKILHSIPPYFSTNEKAEEYIPSDILNKLVEAKKYVKNNRYIST